MGGITGLARAVTDTKGPVGAGAEARDVVGAALELRLGDAGHVVDAEHSAVSAGHGELLGHGGTSKGGSENSERLHLGRRWGEDAVVEAGIDY